MKKLNKQDLRHDRKEHDRAVLQAAAILTNAQNKTTQFAHTEENVVKLPVLEMSRSWYCCGEAYTKPHIFLPQIVPGIRRP